MQKTYQAAAKRLPIVFAFTILMLMATPFTAVGQEQAEGDVFASIRIYDGIDPADLAEAARITIDGFVPILRGSDGFIAYYVAHPVDGSLAAINVFETREQALASNELARVFVEEMLAPLLPNAPMIVEGAVDIGFVEILDGMADADISSLHATIRVYDGFEADDREEFVAIVEEGFLPILRGSEGFFGYYLMHDSAGQVAALSIFDNEASALASNDAAADFVAENLTQYLPTAPSITAGRLVIAVMAEVNDGENIIAERAFVSIRIYEGLDPDDDDGLFRRTAEEFLDIIRDDDGFLGYYWLNLGDTVVAINLFETAEQAAASSEAASRYIAENLADIVPGPPTVVEGEIDLMYVADDDAMMMDESITSLYAALRVYDNYDLSQREEAVKLVETVFLPMLQGADGLFSYFTMDDGLDRVVTLTVYETEENALAANALAAEFVAEYMTAWIPQEPKRINGSLGLAVLADFELGANLIDDMADDSVFASVRVYDGVDPGDQAEIARRTAAGFLPIMRESDGFVGYYLLPAGDMLAAISMFDSAEQAAASNDKARAFVAENLAPLLPNAPTIVAGELDVWHLATLDEMMSNGGQGTLFAALRTYDNYDLTRRDEAVELVDSIFLPRQQEADGLFSYFTMDDGVDRVAALSVYDSKANALAANRLAAEFTAEYMTDWISEEPTRINGSLAIAAFADLHEGANLIDETMDDGVFASVRVYDGVDPADQFEIARLTAAGFLPIMRESDGFVGYYLLPAGDTLAAVSLFDSAAQASASNAKARAFVAENLAPFLPNAPMIVEGLVEASAVDGVMATDDKGSLHALLAIYDGFDMANLAETVALVESIYLPALREAGGLFSYYGISDGVDKAVAFRIMASEESLQRGSEIAADFVAEYLSDWLPESPLQVSGPLAVAALADVEMGANLIDDSVFASVRVYDGVDPGDQAEIARLTDAGFLPIIRESDGFVGYYFLPAEDKLATVSLFDSAEQATASNDRARDFISENLAPLLPNAPRVYAGPLSIDYVAALSAGDEFAGVDELYASVRFYEGFDLRHFDEANNLAIAHLLPALEDLGGLFAQYAFNDGEDTVVGISIFDSADAALAANDVGKAFTVEYLADWAPNPPTGVSGQLAIAALAEVKMGENLVR